LPQRALLKPQRRDAPMLLQPCFSRSPEPTCYPVAEYHRFRWEAICSGELGVDVVNGTHGLLKIKGPLELEALKKAVWAISARHSILTKRVADTAAGPYFVPCEVGIQVAVVDFPAGHEECSTGGIQEVLAAIIWKPFSEHEPWFRPFAITLGKTAHVVGFVIHHFIADGWSTSIIKGELLTAYAAYASRLAPRLAELPISYADFVNGMHEWIRADGGSTSAAYWRSHLRCAPPTQISPDFRAASDERGPLLEQSGDLSSEDVTRLRELARSRGLLMNSIGTAALAAALSVLTGSNDIVIVSRICGRPQPVLFGLVGAFFDSMSVRVAVRMNATFAELAGKVQMTLAQSRPHQSYPYQLVKLALPSIGASELAPMLNFIDMNSGHADHLQGGWTTPLRLRCPNVMHRAGRYNGFNITVTTDKHGLHVTAEYLSVLYRRETAVRLVETFCELLRRAGSAPGERLAVLAASATVNGA
jgi:hypothetical protein